MIKTPKKNQESTDDNFDKIEIDDPDHPEDPQSKASETEKVGYCNPPKATRFKPGQSGNPHGRKKAPLNVSDQIVKALNQKITVTENGKRRRRRRTKQDIMLTSIANKAAKGDIRAAKFLLEVQQSHQEKSQIPLILLCWMLMPTKLLMLF